VITQSTPSFARGCPEARGTSGQPPIAGHQGVVVGLTLPTQPEPAKEPAARKELTFDSATHKLLGARVVLLEAGNIASSAVPKGGVQELHQERDATVAGRGGWIPAKDVDECRCRSLGRLLDPPQTDVRVTGGRLGGARGVCGGTEDVAHLVRLREGMQVGRCRGIAGSGRCVPGGVGTRLSRGPVRVHGGDPLQPRAPGTVDERPGCIDGRARSPVLRVHLLEDRQDDIGAADRVASDVAQVIQAEVEVVRRIDRHGLIIANAEPRWPRAVVTANELILPGRGWPVPRRPSSPPRSPNSSAARVPDVGSIRGCRNTP